MKCRGNNMKYKYLFENKVILITGGTGFLGRELIKTILNYNPHSIRIFSRDEVKHHKVQELFNYNNKLRNLIGDVRDYPRLKRAMEGVDIVIHAAALKRIDLIEYNTSESIKTNVIGSLNVINACLDNDVKRAIFISTDKACSPVNGYGACKFLSERLFVESDFSKGSKKTIFSVVRYGNVLESTGSVIPFFESKINSKEDIPLTDPRMTRFIISSSQAIELIFKALKYGCGGDVFIPKLPSFKITDLIEILKEKHNADIKINIVGVRPGEKIHELMINQSEVPRTYNFEDLYIITSSLISDIQIDQREYVAQGRNLKEEEMVEYSSKDCLMSKEEIYTFFNKLGIIK